MKQLLLALAFFCTYFFNAQTIIKNVDAGTFKKYVDDKKGILLDLRTDEEISKKGAIPGARHLDFFGNTFQADLSKLDKKETYLVYCAGGGRSGECAGQMSALGFKEVINLEKGFDAWKKNNYPTQSAQTKPTSH